MKLTQTEAQIVITEAYRLQEMYKDSRARLGQAIWWCCQNTEDHRTNVEVSQRLVQILEIQSQQNKLDFFYWTDDQKVLEAFYEHFVES